MKNLTIGDVLDRVREVRGLKSDYAIHKAYGISVQKLANWRHGRNLPDENSCQTLADAAQIDPDVLIAQVHAMRAQDSAARAIWERIAERLQVAAHGLAAVIFSVVIASGFIADDARAESASSPFVAHVEDFASSIHRIYFPAFIFAALFWFVSRLDTEFTPLFTPAK